MDLTPTAYGTWSAGRFMHFGDTLPEDRYVSCIRTAWDAGIRTFVTADVYGNGKADELLGEALADKPREEYCLVGTIGHDFYEGQRQGPRGYPRFTELHPPAMFRDYLRKACEKSLERCRTDRFDLLMLHNPDETGYTSDAVWDGLRALKAEGLAERLGLAPGPANGFTLDLIDCIERRGADIDWMMLILNPLEPWPSCHVLPVCEKHGIKVLTRVVDYGGLFHGDMKPGHVFKPGDHRAYRPEGWVEHGLEKIGRMKPVADKHGLTMIQFASIWNLSQPAVECVVPTFIQESGEGLRTIEEQIHDFAVLPDVRLSAEESEFVRQIGDNTGCMMLKGASKRHQVSERPDEWPMREDLLELAGRHGLGTEW